MVSNLLTATTWGLAASMGLNSRNSRFEHEEIAGGVVGQTIDEVNVSAGAFGVAQELVTQADAAVGPFQEAGDLHHHEIPARRE